MHNLVTVCADMRCECVVVDVVIDVVLFDYIMRSIGEGKSFSDFFFTGC